MRIIEIAANELGGHQNQFIDAVIEVPEGWAVIPDDMAIPETFPFVRITVRNGVVKSMVAGTVPPPDPDPPEPEPQGDVWDEIADAIRNGVNMVD